MIFLAVSQPEQPWQRAIREQFNRGGTLSGILLVLVMVAALAVLTYYLADRRQNRERPTRKSDARRFFSSLLSGLGLTLPQRRLLEAMARDLALPHPAVLLLSPGFFDSSIERWAHREMAPSPLPRRPVDVKLVSSVRVHLFPEPTPWIVGDKS